MNLSISFDDSARLVTIHYAGEPTLEEWTETMLAAMGDPRFGPGIKLLLDRRLVGTPSSDFVHGVTDFIGTHRAVLSQCRVAIMVGGIGAYGMARMGQALLTFHGVTFDILESTAALEEWLQR
jgi:aryl carrier-like protein